MLENASRLHALCNREPAAGLAAVEAELAARDARKTDPVWGPLIDAALANAATAAEYRLGRLREAVTRADRTAETLRKNTQLQPPAGWSEQRDRFLASAFNISAVVLGAEGDHANAVRRHHEVLALYRALNDRLNLAKTWHNVSIIYARTMLFADAVAAMRKSAELQEGFPDPDRFREFMTWTHQADVFLEMGDAASAETAALRAVATTATKGLAFGRGEPHAALARAQFELGRPREALKAYGEARRRLEAKGHRVGVAEVLGGLAHAQAALGAHDEARASMTSAVQLALDAGALSDAAKHQVWLGRRALESGDTATALRLAREALEHLAETTGIDPAELAARQLLADGLQVDQQTTEALAAFREFHARYAQAHDARTTLQARILAVQYQLELAQRDADRHRLENARLSEALAEVAARLDAARSGKPAAVVKEVTAESFRPLGLSRRESEVLFWVVRGKSNDEIAIILGCGTETVKTHLKRIYRQLDVTNRAAAAVRAVEFSAGSS